LRARSCCSFVGEVATNSAFATAARIGRIGTEAVVGRIRAIREIGGLIEMRSRRPRTAVSVR
jgi:hypothetical protein